MPLRHRMIIDRFVRIYTSKAMVCTGVFVPYRNPSCGARGVLKTSTRRACQHLTWEEGRSRTFPAGEPHRGHCFPMPRPGFPGRERLKPSNRHRKSPTTFAITHAFTLHTSLRYAVAPILVDDTPPQADWTRVARFGSCNPKQDTCPGNGTDLIRFITTVRHFHAKKVV